MRALVRLDIAVTRKNSTISCCPRMSSQGSLISNSQVTVPEVAVGVELGGSALPCDATALDDGMPVRQAHEPLDVFVDDQDRLSRGAQAGEALPDLLAHQRRQAFGGLIEDQEVRIGHERPADREHL